MGWNGMGQGLCFMRFCTGRNKERKRDMNKKRKKKRTIIMLENKIKGII